MELRFGLVELRWFCVLPRSLRCAFRAFSAECFGRDDGFLVVAGWVPRRREKKDVAGLLDTLRKQVPSPEQIALDARTAQAGMTGF